MAAATEWLNALAAGAEVTSVRRREPVRWPLNVPRALFSRRGLAGFHAASAAGARRDSSRGLLAPSYPPGREWDEPLERAGKRFRVAAEVNGAEQVICATGFRRGFAHDPLLSRLVDDHGLETRDRWIVLAPDSTVPALTDEARTLSIAGIAGAVGLSGSGHARRRQVRGARVPAKGEGMSYTLRGRIDSRLGAALAPAVVAAILALVLHRWWPVEVAGLMVGVGLALDLMLYDRVIDYQPGWLAVPLGALELGLVTGARLRDRGAGAAPRGDRLLRRLVAARAGPRRTPSTRGSASRTPRTAASSDAPASPPRPRSRRSSSRPAPSPSRRSPRP